MEFSPRTPFVWVVLLALVLAACGGSDSTAVGQQAGSEADENSTGSGSEADEAAGDSPDPGPAELSGVLTSTTGEQVDVAQFRGEDVVLWLWAPW